MDITFSELKNKEIINIFDGKRLGRASDICFDSMSRSVTGIIIPLEHRLFKKAEDLFVPISQIKKIGEDVMLVKLSPDDGSFSRVNETGNEQFASGAKRPVYAKYRRVAQKDK